MKKKVLFFSVILVFIDQLIKILIDNFMNLYDRLILIPNFLDITYLRNDGAAFSILSGNRYLFIIVSIITLIFFIRFMFKDNNITKLDTISYSLILSGIVGNLIDRIFRKEVIDYIHFTIFDKSMAVFNFADMCIVFGIMILFYIMFFKGDLNENYNSRKWLLWYKNR